MVFASSDRLLRKIREPDGQGEISRQRGCHRVRRFFSDKNQVAAPYISRVSAPEPSLHSFLVRAKERLPDHPPPCHCHSVRRGPRGNYYLSLTRALFSGRRIVQPKPALLDAPNGIRFGGL